MAKPSKSSAVHRLKGPTGPEIIDQMVASPTLDRFFINKPNFTDEELMEFVKTQQAERALWEVKAEMRYSYDGATWFEKPMIPLTVSIVDPSHWVHFTSGNRQWIIGFSNQVAPS